MEQYPFLGGRFGFLIILLLILMLGLGFLLPLILMAGDAKPMKENSFPLKEELLPQNSAHIPIAAEDCLYSNLFDYSGC